MEELGEDDDQGLEAPFGPVEVVLLDQDGIIVSVNASWCEFAIANGAPPGWTGVGLSFVDACCADDDEASKRISTVLRVALTGLLPTPIRTRIRCDSPVQQRWFDVVVSSYTVPGPSPIRTLVTLTPIAPERADREVEVESDPTLAKLIDHVAQELYAAGLSIQAELRENRDTLAQVRLSAEYDALDQALQHVYTLIEILGR